MAISALSEAREAVNRQRALIDETVKALAAAEKRGGQLVQSINQTAAQIDKLTHQLEVQTKESEEAGNKVSMRLISPLQNGYSRIHLTPFESFLTIKCFF